MELNSQGCFGSEETGLCSLFPPAGGRVSPADFPENPLSDPFSPIGPSDYSFLVGFAFSCSVKGHLP